MLFLIFRLKVVFYMGIQNFWHWFWIKYTYIYGNGDAIVGLEKNRDIMNAMQSCSFISSS